jgi:two-component system, OmpR family, response regulator
MAAPPAIAIKHPQQGIRSGGRMNAALSHVLVVEDDEEIAALVAKYLSTNEYRVTCARDGREMDRVLLDKSVDLIVLDLNLPGEDGLSICRRLRGQDSTIPIVILTAKGEDIDRIIGLELGADDYLSKPFNPRELLARIRAVLRRIATESSRGSAAKTHIYIFSGWRLDTMSRELYSPEAARVALTGAEFDLLHALCDKSGRVLSRDQLLDLTQGRFGGPYERSIDVLISRIRQKIERDPKSPEIIKTIRSEGYLFSPRVERG